jgi:acyl-CoA reductase-like NAD-dependent aldehyde dehydrogenase
MSSGFQDDQQNRPLQHAAASHIDRIAGEGEVGGAGSGAETWGHGDPLRRLSPVDLRLLGVVRSASIQDYHEIVDRAAAAFKVLRTVPAPKRGEVIRQIGTVLRWHKRDLAEVVSREVGKIRAEAEGEVQEMIDMADFAVGLSRMLYRATMPSERPEHRMYEQWHPLGPVGVITAFNFPLAVWSWNAFIALVCGDTVIWKPSSKAALSAVAVMKLIWPVLESNDLPDGILNLVVGSGAVADMQIAIQQVREQGGRILFGGQPLSGGVFDAGTYVTPCIAAAGAHLAVVREETFAPLLYLIRYRTFDEALEYQNAVPHGLASAVFTYDLIEAEAFLSARGSDCGIGNVNIGTSAAEIGGAFGGEKETGGGREAGSDAWKAYMRRQTCTINWSRKLPLAQGIEIKTA